MSFRLVVVQYEAKKKLRSNYAWCGNRCLAKKLSVKQHELECGFSYSVLRDISKLCITLNVKVHIFWESHKMLRNLHLTFVLCCESKVKISKNFVAFSEYMNFDKIDAWKDWNLKLKPFRRFCCLSYWTSHCTSKVHNHLTM